MLYGLCKLQLQDVISNLNIYIGSSTSANAKTPSGEWVTG